MFTGKKIKLRSYRTDDIQRVLELIEESGLRDTLASEPLFPYSFDNEKDFIEKAMKPKGNLYTFAIKDLQYKELVGSCGINEYDEKNRNATVGIWIGKPYQGKGYGKDAMRVLCKFIFDELNTHKIILWYYDFNPAAGKCYSACGFKEEGRHRQVVFRYGQYHDAIYMGLFRNELIEN